MAQPRRWISLGQPSLVARFAPPITAPFGPPFAAGAVIGDNEDVEQRYVRVGNV
jgi:hypothetical protein